MNNLHTGLPGSSDELLSLYLMSLFTFVFFFSVVFGCTGRGVGFHIHRMLRICTWIVPVSLQGLSTFCIVTFFTVQSLYSTWHHRLNLHRYEPFLLSLGHHMYRIHPTMFHMLYISIFPSSCHIDMAIFAEITHWSFLVICYRHFLITPRTHFHFIVTLDCFQFHLFRQVC